MSITHAAESGSGRRLTGGGVFMLLVAFFGLVAAVNAAMIYSAITTFRGEQTSHAYEKGLAYNLDIAMAREQSAREWKVEASILRRSRNDGLFIVALRDSEGEPLSGMKVSVSIRAPVDGKKDIDLELTEAAPGKYKAPTIVEAGWRDVLLTAERDGREAFRSKSRIRIE